MADIDIEVKGLKETRRKMEQMIRDVHGTPILNAMRDVTLMVTRGAKINAPVDTGRLRASITPEIRATSNEVVGVVGSNVVYAPFQEFGTRYMKGRFYLTRAFEAAKEFIIHRFDRALHEIVEKK